jgi:hypothetical protein
MARSNRLHADLYAHKDRTGWRDPKGDSRLTINKSDFMRIKNHPHHSPRPEKEIAYPRR